MPTASFVHATAVLLVLTAGLSVATTTHCHRSETGCHRSREQSTHRAARIQWNAHHHRGAQKSKTRLVPPKQLVLLEPRRMRILQCMPMHGHTTTPSRCQDQRQAWSKLPLITFQSTAIVWRLLHSGVLATARHDQHEDCGSPRIAWMLARLRVRQARFVKRILRSMHADRQRAQSIIQH